MNGEEVDISCRNEYHRRPSFFSGEQFVSKETDCGKSCWKATETLYQLVFRYAEAGRFAVLYGEIPCDEIDYQPAA